MYRADVWTLWCPKLGLQDFGLASVLSSQMTSSDYALQMAAGCLTGMLEVKGEKEKNLLHIARGLRGSVPPLARGGPRPSHCPCVLRADGRL